MKLVIQRVKSASVSIDGQVYNAIQQGLLLLVGVERYRRCVFSQMRKIR